MQKRGVLSMVSMGVVALTGAAALLIGCGSGSGQCGGNAACGGNLVGKWSITGDCFQNITSVMTGTTCSQVGVDASGLREVGTVTFNSDGTYTTNATLSGSLTETLPSSCLTSGGVTVTCDQLNTYFQTSADGGLDGNCRNGAAGSCVCAFQLPSQTSTVSGTYSLSGTNVTFVPAGGTTSTSSYCVQGSTLTLASMAMSMPGVSQGAAEIVLSKQ